MDNITIFSWVFLFLSFVLSVFNISILFIFINRIKESFIEKSLNINAQEFDLIQRQLLLLQAKTDMNTKRVDSIEKILSVMIASGGYSDGGDGILH
jgi:hypothetical protein